jgi:hypothetical protein
MEKYADIVRRVSQEVNDERAAKCGYDLLKGLERGDAKKRAQAWKRYLQECKDGEGQPINPYGSEVNFTTARNKQGE